MGFRISLSFEKFPPPKKAQEGKKGKKEGATRALDAILENGADVCGGMGCSGRRMQDGIGYVGGEKKRERRWLADWLGVWGRASFTSGSGEK